jgi:hypothetical protein
MDKNEFEFYGKVLIAKEQFDCKDCHFHTNESPFCLAVKIIEVPKCYDFAKPVIFVEKNK